MDVTTRPADLWFVLIAVLWIGYFVLEGFDFGVGMLLRSRPQRQPSGARYPHDRAGLGRQRGLADRRRRRDVRRLPGVVRDAVLRLLPRAVPDPGRADRARRRVRVPRQARRPALARRAGTCAIVVGQRRCPRCCWGVAFANIVARRADRRATTSSPARSSTCSTRTRCSAALTTLLLFLAARRHLPRAATDGDLSGARQRGRARRDPGRRGPRASRSWSGRSRRRGGVEIALGAVAAVAAVAGRRCRDAAAAREGWAFAATAVAIVLLRRARCSRPLPERDGRRAPARPSTSRSRRVVPHYTLKRHDSWPCCSTPIVLLYQAWTYWVFRQRVSPDDFRAAARASISSPARGDGGATVAESPEAQRRRRAERRTRASHADAGGARHLAATVALGVRRPRWSSPRRRCSRASSRGVFLDGAALADVDARPALRSAARRGRRAGSSAAGFEARAARRRAR